MLHADPTGIPAVPAGGGSIRCTATAAAATGRRRRGPKRPTVTAAAPGASAHRGGRLAGRYRATVTHDGGIFG